MPIQILSSDKNDILQARVTGKMLKEDFDRNLPIVEQFIETRKPIYLLVELIDFEGWEMEAWWESVKFDTRYFQEIQRIAVVGEKQWHEWLEKFSTPLAAARTRYFEPEQRDEAMAWLKGDRD